MPKIKQKGKTKKFKYTKAGIEAYKKAMSKITGNKTVKTDSTLKSPGDMSPAEFNAWKLNRMKKGKMRTAPSKK
jgi:hypothetical protein|tara:strand:- start:17487 stop:17708 length:222 start_codon:yes stop_codon:yes gene_type:complete